MYGSWDMEHDAHNCLLFWTIYCPFTTLTTQKKFWKKGKNCGDTMILHMCLINDRSFCYFGPFHPLTPLITWKIEILKKWKKAKQKKQQQQQKQKQLEKLPCVSYMKTIWCMVPEIWSAMDRNFCHFRPFFTLILQ